MEPGDPIDVEYRKWGGALHWHFTGSMLGTDEHGLWVGLAPETSYRRGSDDPIVFGRAAVFLVPDGWWSVIFNEPGGVAELYVDINTPATWEAGTVTMIDLDLDVKRTWEGATELLDEDEFAEHRVSLGYPHRVVDSARTTAAELFRRVEGRDEPFGTVGAQWLQRQIGA